MAEEGQLGLTVPGDGLDVETDETVDVDLHMPARTRGALFLSCGPTDLVLLYVTDE